MARSLTGAGRDPSLEIDMPVVDWTDLVPAFGLAIALAACAGLRAWLPLLLTGGLARLEMISLGPAFQFLTTDRALVALALATLIEIAADKVPAVDHTLDVLSTVLRPAAGTLLAASVLWPISDPFTALVLGAVVGVPSSAVPHAAKSALRAASTTFTGGLANPVISLVEDAITLFVFLVSVLVPLLGVLMVVATAVAVRHFWLRRPRPAAA